MAVICGVIGTGAVLGIAEAGKYAAPKLINITARYVPRKSENPDKDQNSISLKRDDVVNKDDVSNNRFALWKSSFEIFQSSPLVGSSPRNLVNYAQKELVLVNKIGSFIFWLYLGGISAFEYTKVKGE